MEGTSFSSILVNLSELAELGGSFGFTMTLFGIRIFVSFFPPGSFPLASTCWVLRIDGGFGARFGLAEGLRVTKEIVDGGSPLLSSSFSDSIVIN